MAVGDEDDDFWWQPSWKTDEEAEPPGAPRRRQPAPQPDYTHPLLAPLARAQDAVARLDGRAEAAPAAIAEGLRARIAYREAGGWLLFARVGVHPRDLALRDAGLTGSYGPAALAGRLEAQLPATTAQGYEFEVAPSDLAIDQALRSSGYGGVWRKSVAGSRSPMPRRCRTPCNFSAAAKR
jgi:hypothetical protein